MTSGAIFTAVEALALAFVLWEFLLGLKRGLSGELPRLISTVIVLTAGLRFYETVGRLLTDHTRLSQNPDMALAVAFLLIVVCLALMFFIVGLALHLLATIKFTDAIDRPAGGLAGLLRGALIVCLCVFAAGLWPHASLRDIVRRQSVVGRTVFRYAPPVVAKLKSIRWLAVGAEPALPELPPLIPEFPADEK